MTNDPLVRAMNDEETESVVRLWRRSREDAQPWLEHRTARSAQDDLRYFREVVAPRWVLWVAEAENTVVGFLALCDAQVDHLYVDPPAQCRGVGTALLRKAKELMPGGLSLFTHQRNAGARRFYEARGFRAVAFGISPPPEGEPDVKYVWTPAMKLANPPLQPSGYAGGSVATLGRECAMIAPSLRLGVLASHEGTTLQAVIDACQSRALDATVVVVISNNSAAGALRRAQDAGIDTRHLSTRTSGSDDALDAAVNETLLARQVNLVLLAGYMKRLGPRTLERFQGRILNTHPALLPRHGGSGMYGIRVHRAVLAVGDAVTGATVHLVTEEYDAGPVLRQVAVPVEPGETPEQLGDRVQAAERQLLVSTLAEVAAGQLLSNPAVQATQPPHGTVVASCPVGKGA